ncbi:MAG: hypothetical protein JSW29_07090 [Candidatus Bathyarchaeota archaeon]|nr:MAG: hypothetical protein JSW29_07090 [Candidatus Bathyarchaeota archaeon]
MWRRKRKIEEKRKETEDSLLKELCRDDARLYDVLSGMLYLDPIAALPRENLKLLIEEAEISIKDEDYDEAAQKYRRVVDKAIFEATQNPEERGRYLKDIQDLASKTIHATEKAKETAGKKGLIDRAASHEKNIEHYKFVSRRVDDVVNVASHFYNEKLAVLGDEERRKTRREKIRALETDATTEVKREAERREVRREARKEMGREARREAEKEERGIDEREAERREVRKEKIRALEREERQEAWGDKERRQARQKKRREARQKELE